jgi:hypothetical protein
VGRPGRWVSLITIGAEVPKSRLLDRVIPRLAERVEAHNRTAEPVWRLRLRVVMHAGEVLRDPKANVGQAVVAACRLLDSPELRARLTSDRSRRRVCSPPCRWPHPDRKMTSGKVGGSQPLAGDW